MSFTLATGAVAGGGRGMMEMGEVREREFVNEGQGLFSCRIENIKIVTEILNCLCINDRKGYTCNVETNNEGMSTKRKPVTKDNVAVIFSVEGKGKSYQARAILQAQLFEEYTLNDPNVSEVDANLKFALSLTTLLDCLQLFGSSSDNTSATMTYLESEATFKISLEESGVLTTCEMLCLSREVDDEDEQLSMFSVFREYPEQCRVIFKSEILKEPIHELFDVVGGGNIVVSTHNRPHNSFKMSVSGSSDIFELDFPQSSDIFVIFQCQANTSCSYSSSSIQLSMKALPIAKETYIRVNSEGMMSIQHQLRETSRGQTFIDFLLLSIEDTVEMN